MAQNRGKQFEGIIREAFEKVPEVSVDRLHDQTMRYKGSQNICDFIVYKEPYEYYFECKSIHGNTFPLNNITDTQWKGLLEKSKIPGVFAGVIVWWIDKDVTLFLPIRTLHIWKTQTTMKSIPSTIYQLDLDVVNISGKKKRVFFEYDMEEFLRCVSNYKN